MANLAGSAFCAYPTVGSFSRSAVADDTGATSGGMSTAQCNSTCAVWQPIQCQHQPAPYQHDSDVNCFIVKCNDPAGQSPPVRPACGSCSRALPCFQVPKRLAAEMASSQASELCFLAGIAGLIAAAVVGLVLAALTPVFQLLPLNVLAAVVVSGVLGVFEWDEALFLYRVSHKP